MVKNRIIIPAFSLPYFFPLKFSTTRSKRWESGSVYLSRNYPDTFPSGGRILLCYIFTASYISKLIKFCLLKNETVKLYPILPERDFSSVWRFRELPIQYRRTVPLKSKLCPRNYLPWPFAVQDVRVGPSGGECVGVQRCGDYGAAAQPTNPPLSVPH